MRRIDVWEINTTLAPGMRTYRSSFVPSSAFAVLLCAPEYPPRPGLCLCVALRLLLAKSLFESILPRSDSLEEWSLVSTGLILHFGQRQKAH